MNLSCPAMSANGNARTYSGTARSDFATLRSPKVGAFGSIAFGIGTSEVEQVFATQCLLQSKPKKMKIEKETTRMIVVKRTAIDEVEAG